MGLSNVNSYENSSNNKSKVNIKIGKGFKYKKWLVYNYGLNIEKKFSTDELRSHAVKIAKILDDDISFIKNSNNNQIKDYVFHGIIPKKRISINNKKKTPSPKKKTSSPKKKISPKKKTNSSVKKAQVQVKMMNGKLFISFSESQIKKLTNGKEVNLSKSKNLMSKNGRVFVKIPLKK